MKEKKSRNVNSAEEKRANADIGVDSLWSSSPYAKFLVVTVFI